MRFLEVSFYDNTPTRTMSSVSVIVRWHEEAGGKESYTLISARNTDTLSRNETNVAAPSKKRYSGSHNMNTVRSHVRLHPTDRLVLNALRSRVIPDELVTRPVRVQELVEECAISRRQVQICLKRLSEKGLVSRLFNNPDNQSGYSYKLSIEEL